MVSIHALLAECDSPRSDRRLPGLRFNPRTPCGVRPVSMWLLSTFLLFQSTHSLRSATSNSPIATARKHCFNPRTPCGVRREAGGVRNGFLRFQSTHSLRSATGRTYDVCFAESVSIHALLAECDQVGGPQAVLAHGFNPRTPCGVRHPKFVKFIYR